MHKNLFAGVFSALVAIGGPSLSQTIDGSDWPSFQSSIELAMENMSLEDRQSFRSGLLIAAYREAGFSDLPSDVHPLLFGMAVDTMPVELNGRDVGEIIDLGRSATPINYNPVLLPSEWLWEQGKQARLLYEASPELAFDFARRATIAHVRRECSEDTLPLMVFQMLGGPEDLQELFSTGGFRDIAVDQSVPIKGIETTVSAYRPKIGFLTSLNDYGGTVYRLAVRAQAVMHRDVFRAATAQTVAETLPPPTCENRYRDHGDYFQTVTPDEISIGNTVTLEKWACGRIKFGIGSKSFKTRLFKTTNSQEVVITPVAELSPLQLGIKIKAKDERGGSFPDLTLDLADQFGADFSEFPDLTDTPNDLMILGATFAEGTFGIDGDPESETPYLALNIHFEDPKRVNALTACTMAAELAQRMPVTLSLPLINYISDGIAPTEN